MIPSRLHIIVQLHGGSYKTTESMCLELTETRESRRESCDKIEYICAKASECNPLCLLVKPSANLE